MLMGCDGIWETQTEKDLIEYIDRRIPNPNTVTVQELTKIVEEFLDWIIAPDTSTGAGCDNMTACIVVFK